MQAYKKICIGIVTILSLSIYAQKGTRTMQEVIFREYDIRGKVGSELSIEETYNLSRSIALYLSQKMPSLKKVAIGMDGRTHSPAIKEQCVKGFLDSGIDAVFIGTCSTPVLYFTMHTKPFDAGVMITASHNTKEYNGFKICLGKESVWGKQIQEIKELYKNKQYLESATKGTYSESLMIDPYVTWMVDAFKHLKGPKISAVIDCGNGSAGTIMPELVKRMGWSSKVMLLYPEVDGNYPNHEADPTVEKNMLDVRKILERTNIEVGIGLDGDCDRMAPMTKEGFLVPGDQLLGLFAQQVIKEHPGSAVVFDVKSSVGLIDYLESIGAKPCMSPSGHSIIKDYMKKNNAFLGGELSCHFFFHDRYFGYDDGVYAMMRLFEILLDSQKTLQELLSVFPKKYSSPEYRVICQEDQKYAIVDAVKSAFMQRADVKAITIDGIRASMPYGWGIARVSNTQPAITIRFESDSPAGLAHVKQDFYDVLKSYFDAKWLADQLGL
ncbi:MAG: phosphomannomutase/phosphoglucomutase [Candidatus Babeliales bacterium]|nr:phosphomannomutase/phosphoglucomutase [Candidatus Babeliales bacterium]